MYVRGNTFFFWESNTKKKTMQKCDKSLLKDMTHQEYAAAFIYQKYVTSSLHVIERDKH